MSELLLIAIDPDRKLAGISTAYLARNDQLGGDLWHIRVSVPTAYQRSHLATALAVAARERVVERFTSGADTRGLGAIFEVENEVLKRVFPQGLWYETDFVLIGDSPQGAHVRVHYFPGVHAPEPAVSTSTYG